MHILHCKLCKCRFCYAKIAKYFCINTRKTRRNNAHTQHMEHRTKTPRNLTKNSPKKQLRIKTNDAQIKNGVVILYIIAI